MRRHIAALLLLVFVVTPVAADRAEARETLQIRAVWVELSANLPRLATRDKIRETLRKVSDAGFNTVIFEAKGTAGYAAYQSKIAPRINDLALARKWYPEYDAPKNWIDPQFDILEVMIEEAHQLGLKVYAAMQTLVEGQNELGVGPALDHPDWQSVYYFGLRYVSNRRGASRRITNVNQERGGNGLALFTENRFRGPQTSRHVVEVEVGAGVIKKILDRSSGSRDPGTLRVPAGGYLLVGRGTTREWILANFRVGDRLTVSPVKAGFVKSGEQDMLAWVNPAHPEVIAREVSLAKEIATNYDIDGFVLDRVRYFGVAADFSDVSRRGFEAHLGKSVPHWPEDIIRVKPARGWFTNERGPLFAQWVAWRALVLQKLIAEIRLAVKAAKPDIPFVNYVGSWYGSYWNEGVNWGSTEYRPGFSWTSDEWQRAGTAKLYDYLLLGTFYSPSVIEKRVSEARRITKGKTKVLTGIWARIYAPSASRYRNALRTAAENPDGFMVFDFSDIERLGWWNETKSIIK